MEERLSYSTAALVAIDGHQVICHHQEELPKVGGKQSYQVKRKETNSQPSPLAIFGYSVM